MVNIKMKFIIIFLLFNILLFINMFKKFKESIISSSCIVTNRPMGLNKIKTMTDCKKKKFHCLSANCNKEINKSFNSSLIGENALDEFGQNLSAYCCRKCRDTGGCECDTNCTSHDSENLTTPYHGINESSLCNSYKENFSSITGKEGMKGEYHDNLMPIVTNTGYNCKDGIVDPANCDCYSPYGENNYNFTTEPDSQNSNNCGPYRFYQCYNDPSCITSFNSIRMGSFKEIEPVENRAWGTNLTNIILNKDFNGSSWGSEFPHLYSRDEIKASTGDSPNSIYQSILANKNINDFGSLGWCQDVCNKASNLDNNGGQWNDRLDLLETPEENSFPTQCAQSDVMWAAKFLCRSCNMYDENRADWANNDLNLARYECDDGSYSTDITNKFDWNYVDSVGEEASNKFLNSKDANGNYTQYNTLIHGTSNIPDTKWNKNRDITHLQFYCRAACGQELAEKCHSSNPSNSDLENIRNQCRAACIKRLPCPGILKRLAGLKSASGIDGDAPKFADDAVPPCTDENDEDNPRLPGSCNESGEDISWEKYRDIVNDVP